MQQNDTPKPAWHAFAETVIERLKAHHAARGRPDARTQAKDDDDDDDVPDDDDRASETSSEPRSRAQRRRLLDELMATPDYPQLPSDAADALREAGADPDATLISGENRPAQPLPAPALSLAIRLAATIGDEAALQHCTAPGSVTLITGIVPDDLACARDLFGEALFPPEQPVSSEPRHYGSDHSMIVLAPKGRDDEVGKAALSAFHDKIHEALDRTGALILLVPDTSSLPPHLQRGINNALGLAPLNRDVLITHLRHSHSATGRIDEAAVRDALPDDRLLSSLPFTTLRLALRAPTARAVAERIAELCGSSRQDGPDLDAMTGSSPALNAARRMIADLRLWQQGKVKWTELSRSMLLYGPPGTGKTWLARAMGNTAGIAMVEASFAAWQSAGHLGDLLREMRRSFAEARRLAPAILFIDEIDAVGSREDGDMHGSRYQMQVINGFLGEMDSIAREEGVLVVGACNYVDRIDPAVLRAGRFDIRLPMPLPDQAAILGMLQRHLRDEIADDDLQTLATSCVGQSAAAVDAAIRAARSDARHDKVPLSVSAIRRHLGIDADPAQAATDWRVAVHECGHAIACAALRCGTVTRLLLTPDGGETRRRAGAQQAVLADLEAEIAYNLAGRAAERLILGDVSGGAGGAAKSDLAQATRLALAIDVILGLGADGPVWTAAPDHELLRDPAVRARVRQRLEAAEQRATDILAAQEPLLRDMANALLQKRELAGPQLAPWLGQVTVVGHPRQDQTPAQCTQHPLSRDGDREHAPHDPDTQCQPIESPPTGPAASE
ncbi:Peptidase family M41 [Paracoccus pantotrophus]|nr:Peptidase family M41 [Paracoccus pantotrophus]